MNSKLTINSPSSNQYIPLPQIADFISELNNITFHENLSKKFNLSVFTSCTNISHINNTNIKKYFNHNQLINNNKYTKSYIDFFSDTTDDIFTNKNISNIYPINNNSITNLIEANDTQKKTTKPKVKELKVVKLGQIGLSDNKYNNNNRRSPQIEMRRNIKNGTTQTKTIILNKEQFHNGSVNINDSGIVQKFHSGGNSPIIYHNNNNNNNTNDNGVIKKIKNVNNNNSITTNTTNKSPVNKIKTIKPKGNSPSNNINSKKLNGIIIKTNAKSPSIGKHKKQMHHNNSNHNNNNNLECSKIILNKKPNTIHYISISPKPGSPTEMHDEMKSNIGTIKNSANNQSLAYPSSKHHNYFFRDNDTSSTDIKEKQIKKTKQKKSPANTNKPIQKTNKDKHKRNILNKSFDCIDKGINVFDSSDNIFEYVNNTIIEPTPKRIVKNKNKVLPTNQFTININKDNYGKPIANGIRYTGKFNKNKNNHNKNNITVDYDDSSFDRFSFKNHFLP